MDFELTVIIPMFNAENSIERAVDSVLSQPQVKEILIIDDGSKDASVSICLKKSDFDNRIKVLTHKNNINRGVSAARNLGIKNASNNFLAFLDADDFYLPNRFNYTKTVFGGDESIEGVYEMTGRKSGNKLNEFYSKIDKVDQQLLFENLQPLGEKVWFHIDGLTVKKSLLKKSGYFDESLKTSEDTLQWFKMAAVGKLVGGIINSPVAINENSSLSLTSDTVQVKKDFIKMLFKVFYYCIKKKCHDSRKDLVLNKIIFQIGKSNDRFFSNVQLAAFFIKSIVSDPTYFILRSSAFRLYVGNLIKQKKISFIIKPLR